MSVVVNQHFLFGTQIQVPVQTVQTRVTVQPILLCRCVARVSHRPLSAAVRVQILIRCENCIDVHQCALSGIEPGHYLSAPYLYMRITLYTIPCQSRPVVSFALGVLDTYFHILIRVA